MDLGMHEYGMYCMTNNRGNWMLPNFLLHFFYDCRASFWQHINISILWSRAVQEGGAIDAGKCLTTRVLIPDIYFCLFSLCSGLHGSNFCCDETEKQSLWSSLQRESQCPPPLLPGQQGFADLEGWVSLGGGGVPTEWSEGVAGGGYSGEARRKETINTQLMTSNKLTTQQKLMERQKWRNSHQEQMAECFLSLDSEKEKMEKKVWERRHIIFFYAKKVAPVFLSTWHNTVGL